MEGEGGRREGGGGRGREGVREWRELGPWKWSKAVG